MARYKHYDLNQTKMIPLSYADQIVEGSFEHALNEIVEDILTCRCLGTAIAMMRRAIGPQHREGGRPGNAALARRGPTGPASGSRTT